MPQPAMLVKCWGARGSIPAPLKPADVYAKAQRLIENLMATGGTESLKGNDGHPDPAKIKSFLDSQPLSVVGTYGGNTTCFEVQAKDSPLVIIDMGSGGRELGLELMRRKFSEGGKLNPLSDSVEPELHLLFTHLHWDHIQGFPFFVPAFLRDTILHFYAKRNHRRSLEDTLRGQQEFPNFPVQLDDLPCVIDPANFHDIRRMRPAWLKIGNLHIQPSELSHPDGAFGYRVTLGDNAFVMATDTEQRNVLDPRLLELAKGAVVMYYDAQYTPAEYPGKFDWGHSTYEWGIQTALAAGVQILVLGHHEPTRDDFGLADLHASAIDFAGRLTSSGEHKGKKLQVLMAYEGLEIPIG